MPKETYIAKRFSAGRLAIIQHATAIIEEYERQGFTLTLRQLYYQFVARDLIPNRQSEYKRLGSIISDARLAGLIDWLAIEDRTRSPRGNPHWSSPESIIQSCADGYAIDKWADQPCRIEVWIEKDALTGVIAPACNELDIDYFACRGYSSLSAQWAAGKRFLRYCQDDQKVVVLHFGDHDPSGIDMTRDNRKQTKMFSGSGRTIDGLISALQDATARLKAGREGRVDWGAGTVEVIRVALNMDQVEEYAPPPNPVKLTDSRANAYMAQFGADSWELDALEPTVIDRLIRDAVAERLDREAWDAAVAREEEQRDLLHAASERWAELTEILKEGD